MTDKTDALVARLRMHARDCVSAADMDTDTVLSAAQIDDMADAINEAAKALAAPAEGGQGEVAFYAPARLVENCRLISGAQSLHRVILSTKQDTDYPVPFYTDPPAASVDVERLRAIADGIDPATGTMGCKEVADKLRTLIDSAGGAKVYQCPRCSTSLEVDPTAKPAPQPDGGDGVEHEGDTCRSNDLYAGNSVGWWKSKADNYKNGLLKVCDALGSIGVKMDGNTPCWEYVAALTRPAATAVVPDLIAEWEMLIEHPDTSTIMRTTLRHVVERLKAAAPAAPKGGVVDDAMVERLALALQPNGYFVNSDHHKSEVKRVRSALTAVREGGEAASA